MKSFEGWYCAHCQRGVDASEVTFHEQHTVCGRTITDDTPPPERDALREQLRQLEQRDFQELARANERIDALMNEVRTLRDDRRAAGERVKELVDALELARGEIAHYFKEIRHLGGSWEVKRVLDRVDQVLDAYLSHGDAAMQEGKS